MPKKSATNEGNGKGTVRVFFAEFTGDNETIQEGLKAIAAAVNKTFQPKTIVKSGAPRIAQTDEQAGRLEEDVIDVEGEYVDDDEDDGDYEGHEATPVKPASPPRTRRPPTRKLIGDLNLRPEGQSTFWEFCQQKNPLSVPEFIAVFVYYLQHKVNVDKITYDHIFTCFKKLPMKVPKNVDQSVRDCASKKAWIRINEHAVVMEIDGENFVEHDLPAKGSKSE